MRPLGHVNSTRIELAMASRSANQQQSKRNGTRNTWTRMKAARREAAWWEVAWQVVAWWEVARWEAVGERWLARVCVILL